MHVGMLSNKPDIGERSKLCNLLRNTGIHFDHSADLMLG